MGAINPSVGLPTPLVGLLQPFSGIFNLKPTSINPLVELPSRQWEQPTLQWDYQPFSGIIATLQWDFQP